jgi:hypothetical protein
MASNNYIYKMSNAGGMSTVTRYTDMLAGNTTWNPWEPQGAYDALSTVTVPSGGVASVTFAAIPNTYKHLQIRWLARDNFASDASDVNMRFNSDSAANYSWHQLVGDGSTAAAYASTSQTSMRAGFVAGSTAGSNVFAPTVLDLLDYANTSKNKTVRNLAGYDKNIAGSIGLQSGSWMNTAAINTISITPRVGTTFSEFSQFTLYGVK